MAMKSIWMLVFFCQFSQGTAGEICHSTGDNTSSLSRVNEVSSVLDTLLRNYDKRIRPDIEGPPVKVSITMHILATVPINEIDMDFTATFFFRQYWTDHRLAFSKYTELLTIKPTSHIIDQIWVPDSFFENDMTDHKTRHDFLLEMTSEGYVTYSSRKRVRSYCPMDLRRFPMDEQMCELSFESYAYSEKDIVYAWKPNQVKPVTLSERLNIPEYYLVDWQLHSRNNTYITGNFSALQITFQLKRKIGFYIIQNFIPTALIVMLSWVGFWINEESVPARVSLGITTVLAITTLIFGVQASLPKVGYIKAIDFFLLGSFLFVFGALIEFAVICTLTDPTQGSAEPSPTNNTAKTKPTCDSCTNQASPFDIQIETHEVSWEAKEQVNKPIRNPSCSCFACFRNKIEINKTSGEHDETAQQQKPSHPVDKASRILFPLAFLVFIVVYCIVFVVL